MAPIQYYEQEGEMVRTTFGTWLDGRIISVEPGPTDFLYNLLAEVDSYDEEAFPPHREMAAEEKFAADCTPFMKKLYSLSGFYRQRFNRSHTNPYRSEQLYRAEQAEKALLLRSLFWAEASALTMTWRRQSLGLRKDWKIVRYEKL